MVYNTLYYILELLTVRILLGGLVNHVLSVLSSSAHEWSAACVSSHDREEGESEGHGEDCTNIKAH